MFKWAVVTNMEKSKNEGSKTGETEARELTNLRNKLIFLVFLLPFFNYVSSKLLQITVRGLMS